MWHVTSDIMGIFVLSDFESMAKYWLRGKKYNIVNIFSIVVLWTIWKTRNDLCFQGTCWLRVEMMFGRCAILLRN
jgi:hypothetical protein